MKAPKSWLQGKLEEPCKCNSGKSYRLCCLRRETAYLVIGTAATLALFGAHDAGLVAVVPIIVVAALAGWFVSRRYGRVPEKDKRDSR